MKRTAPLKRRGTLGTCAPQAVGTVLHGTQWWQHQFPGMTAAARTMPGLVFLNHAACTTRQHFSPIASMQTFGLQPQLQVLL